MGDRAAMTKPIPPLHARGYIVYRFCETSYISNTIQIPNAWHYVGV